VPHRDAEPDRLHVAYVGDLVSELGRDLGRACVVAGVGAVAPVVVVRPALAGDAGEVGVVGEAEVVERDEEVLLQRISQAQPVRRAPTEEITDVEAVAAFRCGRESEQLLRLQVIEQLRVRARAGVVELVDDDDVELRGIDPLDPLCAKARLIPELSPSSESLDVRS
jgi:hypothetical protein